MEQGPQRPTHTMHQSTEAAEQEPGFWSQSKYSHELQRAEMSQ